jgi:hypothetical protein
LLNKLCYLACPLLVTIQNTLLNTCDACPINCTQCTGDYTLVTCTRCLNGYVIDNGGCYLDCVTAGLVKSAGSCVSCSSICDTCSIGPTNCTSCSIPSSNPYLVSFHCLSSCPATFYPTLTSTCLPCIAPC